MTDVVTKSVGWIDWGIVMFYFLAVMVVGAWYARRQKSTEQYFVGGRSVPGWAAGLSMFAGTISTATFLAYPGNGFGGDWTLLWPGFMLPVVAVFVTLLIIPFYRQIVRMSVYEYMEQRFGYLARAYAAVVYIMINLFRMGFVLFLAGKALSTMTGWDIRLIIIVSGLVTLAYTSAGGLNAVIWTDVLQCLILLAGGLVCAGLILFTSGETPWNTLLIAYDADKFRLAELSLDLARPTIIVMTLNGLFNFASGYSTTQDTVQRYLATSSTHEARRGMWLGAFSCLLTWTLFMFIGSLLYSYYTIHPDQLPADIAAEEVKVFPHFVMTRFPVGMVGFVLAALCAAAMSTLSSQMNTMSMVTIYDFWSRLRTNTSDAGHVILSKAVTCFWGLAGTAAALSMINVQKALEFSYVFYSILAGGIFGVFLLALFVRRAHARGAYVGLLTGALISAWGVIDQLVAYGLPLPEVIKTHPFPLHPFVIVACSNLASFVVGYLACLIIPPKKGHPSTGATVWDLKTR